MSTSHDALAASARAFLEAAWVVLEHQHVVPLPAFHPFIKVGRDYFGPDLMARAEFTAFETAINAAAPRFGDDIPLQERDFANAYIFSFLEAFAAELTITGEPFSTIGQAADRAVVALQEAVNSSSSEVACCRHVSHLSTIDGEPIDVTGVTVIPLRAPPHGHAREAIQVMQSVISRAETAFGRDPPTVYAPPDCIIVARATDPKPFDVANRLSQEIERLLLLIRLLYAGTCESIYEVQGGMRPVGQFTPILVRFRGTGGSMLSGTNMVRRAVRLSAEDNDRFLGLERLMLAAETERPGMALTSFAMAVQKLQVSYHAHSWYEQLVDLATALEAALSGKDTSDVLLRLRTRAAALLCTDRDPAAAIFGDVGRLYALRSSLVHGGELKEKDLLKTVRSVTTVPQDAPFGIALGHMVDRLRDLVRRALLARICLAGSNEPLWPLAGDAGVDACLADDKLRTKWRTTWHGELAAINAPTAGDRPRLAADILSREQP